MGLLVFLWAVVSSQAADLPPLTHNLTAVKGSPLAPLLRLKNMDDEIVDIKALQGKVIVLNFWATWCPPCRREMSSLEKLHLATAEKDVVVLAVNIGEDEETVFSFMGVIDTAPTFPVLLDPDSLSLEHWKVQGLPTTYIIDKNGKIAYRAVGGREFDHPDIIRKVVSLAQKSLN
ncbi:MAG TPA: TlpA family protein disulfide reductase [Gammaproteobacteria bacterium]|nr:TlpA family protein disulfide reductase [Gammaproteobacteria bacterium]